MLLRAEYAEILATMSDERIAQELVFTAETLAQVEGFLTENPDAPDYAEALDFYQSGQEAFGMAMEELCVRAEIAAGFEGVDDWTWED